MYHLKILETVDGDSKMMRAALRHELQSGDRDESAEKMKAVEPLLVRGTLGARTFAALAFNAAIGIATGVLVGKLSEPYVLVVAGIAMGATVIGFKWTGLREVADIRNSAPLGANRSTLSPPFWVFRFEDGVVRGLAKVLGKCALAFLAADVCIFILHATLFVGPTRLPQILIRSALAGSALAFLVAFLPVYVFEAALKYRTSDLTVSINLSVRYLFSHTKTLKVLTGSLNPDFWGNPRIIGALAELQESGTDLTIWCRDPKTIGDGMARKRVYEELLPQFRTAGIIKSVRFLESAAPLQHFMLADRGRCRIEDWHAPFWQRATEKVVVANNVYFFNPVLATELRRWVNVLERQPSRGAEGD